RAQRFAALARSGRRPGRAAAGTRKVAAGLAASRGPAAGRICLENSLESPVAAHNAKTALQAPHGIPEKVRCRKDRARSRGCEPGLGTRTRRDVAAAVSKAPRPCTRGKERLLRRERAGWLRLISPTRGVAGERGAFETAYFAPSAGTWNTSP